MLKLHFLAWIAQQVVCLPCMRPKQIETLTSPSGFHKPARSDFWAQEQGNNPWTPHGMILPNKNQTEITFPHLLFVSGLHVVFLEIRKWEFVSRRDNDIIWNSLYSTEFWTMKPSQKISFSSHTSYGYFSRRMSWSTNLSSHISHLPSHMPQNKDPSNVVWNDEISCLYIHEDIHWAFQIETVIPYCNC